jgi:hypothetical protein
VAKVTHVAVTNGPGNNGQGVVLVANSSSMSTKSYLVQNMDPTNSFEGLGLNDDGTRQTLGNGYTWLAGAEKGIDLAPGETLYAASAVGVTVQAQVLEIASVDVGG